MIYNLAFLPKKNKIFRIYTASSSGQMGFIDIPEDSLYDQKNRRQILLKKWKAL